MRFVPKNNDKNAFDFDVTPDCITDISRSDLVEKYGLPVDRKNKVKI